MNIARLIDDNIDRFGEYDQVYFEDKWHTNVEMRRAVNRLGNALKALGIRKGDHVGVQLKNCVAQIHAFLAILRIGAIIVPINPSHRSSELAYTFQDSDMTAVLSSIEFLDKIDLARREAPALKHAIIMGGNDTSTTVSYETLVSNSPEHLSMEEVDNDEIAVLIYTAGTTGKPKGVMLTHYNLYSNFSGCCEVIEDTCGANLKSVSKMFDPKNSRWIEYATEVYGLSRNRRLMIVLPLFHIYGLGRVMIEYLAGGGIILLKGWDVELCMKSIERFKITEFYGVPTMYAEMLNFKDADNYNLNSLQFCICGGAPMPLEIGKEWKKRYGIHISEGYGLSEASAINTGQPRQGKPKFGSVGRTAIKANSIKIFGERDVELPRGETGEIVIKGPTVMKGYWKLPEETARALKNGWLHTGDIGHMDDDDFIYITERKKDIIIRGGENICPTEVEDVLYRNQKVREAGVIGIDDDIYGEEVKAFVALKSGESATQEELMDFCRQHLPHYKTPKSVEFMDALPKSPVGKILRRELRRTDI